jgi:hypothetical protein
VIITTLTDDRLVVDCPRVGTAFLCFFAGAPAFFALVLFAQGSGQAVAMALFLLIFVVAGLHGLWHGGHVTLTLDRATGLATVTRSYPRRIKTETIRLADIDDVTNARDSETTQHGLSFEVSDGTTVRIAHANYANPEARGVGKQIRTWLKQAGYR